MILHHIQLFLVHRRRPQPEMDHYLFDTSTVTIRGERIIRYSNIIRIIFEYQNIRIRNR